jgi:hypothetical protein
VGREVVGWGGVLGGACWQPASTRAASAAGAPLTLRRRALQEGRARAARGAAPAHLSPYERSSSLISAAMSRPGALTTILAHMASPGVVDGEEVGLEGGGEEVGRHAATPASAPAARRPAAARGSPGPMSRPRARTRLQAQHQLVAHVGRDHVEQRAGLGQQLHADEHATLVEGLGLKGVGALGWREGQGAGALELRAG